MSKILISVFVRMNVGLVMILLVLNNYATSNINFIDYLSCCIDVMMMYKINISDRYTIGTAWMVLINTKTLNEVSLLFVYLL